MNHGRLTEIEKLFINNKIREEDLFFHLVSGIIHMKVVLCLASTTSHCVTICSGLAVWFDRMRNPFAFLYGLKMATFTAAAAFFNALSLVARGNRSRMASSRNAVS